MQMVNKINYFSAQTLITDANREQNYSSEETVNIDATCEQAVVFHATSESNSDYFIK